MRREVTASLVGRTPSTQPAFSDPCADDRPRSRGGRDHEEQARLLLLEDDPVLARALARRLFDRDDHAGEAVTTLAAARAALAERRYDCMVLDRIVPDGDAIDLVEELQGQPHRPPVLILSGMADTDERIRGLEIGADEYLAKPARLEEVALRVQALLERAASLDGAVVRMGQVALDRARGLVTLAGEKVHLTPHQFAVFHYLVVNRSRVVGVDELLDHCWDGERQEPANPVHSQVTRLRTIFRGHLRFDAVRGVGYLVRMADAGPGPVGEGPPGEAGAREG